MELRAKLEPRIEKAEREHAGLLCRVDELAALQGCCAVTYFETRSGAKDAVEYRQLILRHRDFPTPSLNLSSKQASFSLRLRVSAPYSSVAYVHQHAENTQTHAWLKCLKLFLHLPDRPGGQVRSVGGERARPQT